MQVGTESIPDLGRAHVPQRHPRTTTVSLRGEPERPSLPSLCSPRTGEPVAHTRSSLCREKPAQPLLRQPEKSPSGGKGPAQPKLINRQNNLKKQNPLGESARLSRRGPAVFLFLFFSFFPHPKPRQIPAKGSGGGHARAESRQTEAGVRAWTCAQPVKGRHSCREGGGVRLMGEKRS